MVAGSAPREGGLVEREREVDALERLLGDVLAGDGRVALIEGPAGIGKSRLLQLARRRAEDAGAIVLAARSSELEREFPYGVVRQLLEAQIVDPAARERAFAGAAAPARAVFEPAAAPEGDASFGALHGLYWLLLNLAEERPLVLAVDDLHWCDRPSLRFLAYVTRRLEGLPILLAATARTADPGTDPALVGEIAADLATVALRPGPLTEEAVRTVVRDALGAGADPAFCAAVHRASGGNPLLVRQLVRALEAEGVRPDAASAGQVRDIAPGAVARTVLVRLARQPPEVLAVARAVAVLGEGASLPAVAAIAGVDEHGLVLAHEALARAEILRPEPPLGFVHALVRDAVYRELPHPARAQWHERAAAVLRELGAGANQVAAQLLSVPPKGDAEVAAFLHDAGRAAFARGAPDSAVGLLARALAEPPAPERRAAVLLDLGLSEMPVDGAAAVAHVREAHAGLDDPVARGRVGVLLTQLLTFTGAPDEGEAVAQESLAALPAGHDDLRDRLRAQRFFALHWVQARTGELAPLDELAGGIEHAGGGARMLETVVAVRLAYQCRPADECVALVERAWRGGTLLEEDDGVFSALVVLVQALADRDEALTIADELQARAHRRGSLFGLVAMWLWGGWTHLRRGELVDAEERLRDSVAELARWHGAAGGDANAAGVLAQVLVERGDLDGARATLSDRRRGGLDRSLEGTRWWLAGECDLLLAAGEPAAALALSERLRVEHPHALNPGAGSWRSPRARALHALGRTDEAIPVAEENLALARRFGAPGVVGRALRELGELRGGDPGLADLEAAVAALDGCPARLELAKALAAQGRALRHARRPADARDPLRRALELADAAGAAGLAGDVRTELYAAGARPRTAALGGEGALTASERRVAGLAAEGASNRDIAQALFVTPKTVEVHLSNAYRKLGIRSRRELTGVLGH